MLDFLAVNRHIVGMTPKELLARRNALGLSQAAFAEVCQVTKRAVQDWEHRNTPIRYVVGRGLDVILDELEAGGTHAIARPPRRRPRAAPRLAERG